MAYDCQPHGARFLVVVSGSLTLADETRAFTQTLVVQASNNANGMDFLVDSDTLRFT